MNCLRVLFVGGLTSYRALFNWISPWVFFPILVVYPLFQILFFAYLGRFAGVGSDEFFLIGNTFIATATAGLFGMGHAVANERRSQTLASILASPASRFALFLGRTLPSIVTGFGKHLENVYAKLGVNRRTAAVARFLGLIEASERAASAG